MTAKYEVKEFVYAYSLEGSNISLIACLFDSELNL